MNRRHFLGVLGCFALKGFPFAEEVLLSLERGEELFPQGVSSGEVGRDSVLLWTRLAVKAKAPLKLRVVSERGEEVFKREVTPREGGAVKVKVRGLRPSTRYAYAFSYRGEEVSGTFKTLPTKAERLRFALVTCQNYENGYFGAYGGIAEEELDFVLHLGDAIYERVYGDSIRPYQPRLPSGSPVALSLEDYRFLHRLYLSDSHYKKARALQSFFYIWDDHEFANDCAYDYEKKLYRLPKHPYDGDPVKTAYLRRAFLKAWEEHTPREVKLNLRAEPVKMARAYRSFELFPLARLILTDERSYRDLQPFYGREPKTMLGEEQKVWFKKEVLKGGTEWILWANEVLFSPIRSKGYKEMDGWNGYEREREELLRLFEKRKKVLVLSGDRHSAMLWEHPWGAEVMAPPLSSMNALDKYRRKRKRLHPQRLEEKELRENPSLKWVSHQAWGYAVVELERSGFAVSYEFCDKNFPRSPVREVFKAFYEEGKGFSAVCRT